MVHATHPDNFTERQLISTIKRIPWPTAWTLQHIRTKLEKASTMSKSFQIIINKKSFPQRFPIWLITYWDTCQSVADDIQLWSKVVSHLEREANKDMLGFLKTVPWDGNVPRRFGAQMKDLAGLATNNWLTGSQIDMFAEFFNQDLQEHNTILNTSLG